uniref:Uncharacterized protein n=1 Tax=Arundo donax TaxID=35708 RepID=A0A0A9C6I7_ARUDO
MLNTHLFTSQQLLFLCCSNYTLIFFNVFVWCAN